MAKRQSYEELEQRVTKLEEETLEYKHVEEELRESEKELKAIFNAVREGVAVFDMTGKIVKINNRILEVGGYSEDEIIGKRFEFMKMFPPKSIVKMLSNFKKLISGKETPRFEVEVYKKTGEKLNVELHGSPLRKRGKIVGMIGIMRDITERKQAEKALRDIKNEAMKLRQEVSQLRGQRESYLGRMKVIAESLLNFIESVDEDFRREDDAFSEQIPGLEDTKPTPHSTSQKALAQAAVALSIGTLRVMGSRLRGIEAGRKADDPLRVELNRIREALAKARKNYSEQRKKKSEQEEADEKKKATETKPSSGTKRKEAPEAAKDEKLEQKQKKTKR